MSIAPASRAAHGRFRFRCFGLALHRRHLGRSGQHAKTKRRQNRSDLGSRAPVWLPLDVYLVPARGADEHTEDHARGRGARHPGCRPQQTPAESYTDRGSTNQIPPPTAAQSAAEIARPIRRPRSGLPPSSGTIRLARQIRNLCRI